MLYVCIWLFDCLFVEIVEGSVTAATAGDRTLEWVSMPSGSLVTCRVCQATIDISDKREQHVVKCSHCNEATVSKFVFPVHQLSLMCKQFMRILTLCEKLLKLR